MIPDSQVELLQCDQRPVDSFPDIPPHIDHLVAGGVKNTEHFCLPHWARSMLIPNQLQMESPPTKKHFIYKN